MIFFTIRPHPYTKGLLRSMPNLREEERTRLIPIEGNAGGSSGSAQGLQLRPQMRALHEDLP